MKKGIKIILLIVFATICAFLIGAYIFAYTRFHMNEANTTEIEATVSSVYIDDTEKEIQGTINTVEYGKAFYLPKGLNTTMDIDGIKNLAAGQHIYVRVENLFIENLHSKYAIFTIITLRTDQESILTFDQFNEYEKEIDRLPRIECCVLAFFSAAAFIFVSRYKCKKKEAPKVAVAEEPIHISESKVETQQEKPLVDAAVAAHVEQTNSEQKDPQEEEKEEPKTISKSTLNTLRVIIVLSSIGLTSLGVHTIYRYGGPYGWISGILLIAPAAGVCYGAVYQWLLKRPAPVWYRKYAPYIMIALIVLGQIYMNMAEKAQLIAQCGK